MRVAHSEHWRNCSGKGDVKLGAIDSGIDPRSANIIGDWLVRVPPASTDRELDINGTWFTFINKSNNTQQHIERETILHPSFIRGRLGAAMTEEEAEKLLSLLQSGHSGVEAFLGLPADDRATIMTMLERAAWADELRQILKQCEADGTMDKIRALLAEQRTKRKEE